MVRLGRLCLNAAVLQSTEIRNGMVMTVRSHVGRVRARNEDSVLGDPGAGLALLADGMGGLAAGEVASALSIEVVYGQLVRSAVRSMEKLKTAILSADREIHLAALARGLVMGTTFVAWQRLAASSALVAHVGDSRCYRLRGNTLSLLTRDHSVVQQRLEAGQLTEIEAWLAPDRHLITQALGLGEPVNVELAAVECEAGDRFLLCSDGLNDMVEAGELNRLCGSFDDDTQLADALVQAGLEAGGRDNLSLILVRLY